jgi:single-stranded-DNA-specific exonuclease
MEVVTQQKQWTLKPAPDANQLTHLQKAINVSELTAGLLLQRGIDTFEKAKHFFRAGASKLHAPQLLTDMDKALPRLIAAIEKQEKILLYGDYDVDGTTSVSLLYAYLRQFHQPLLYYVPDRYNEGYGVSEAGIDFAIAEGVQLLITLDCGIKAVDKVARAQQAGIDVIICDHHKPGKTLPPAIAVLDPNRPDCSYPCKALSGCGVGFKLLQALEQAYPPAPKNLFTFLDFVAISTACDIVPIVGENRILVREGLKCINHSPRPAIQALIDIAGVYGDVTVDKLVFGFGPRINAAGRLKHASSAIELLTATTEDEAKPLVVLLQKLNDERRQIDSTITDEALAAATAANYPNTHSTVLHQPDWHKGVVGIVASRCIERLYRPTVICTTSKGKLAGSARSVEGFDIYKALEACNHLLIQFGGHTHAAGMTLLPENFEAFQQKFDEVVRETATEEVLTPKVVVDLEVRLEQLTPKFFKILSQMEPFGPGNLRPVLMVRNVLPLQEPQLLKGQHLKMRVSHTDASSAVDMNAIGFRMEHLYPLACSGKALDLCFNLTENTFRGFTSLQLQLIDVKLHQP